MFGNNPTLRFPGNLPQVRSLSELRDVSPYNMNDESAILVTKAGLFTFDASSMANDDGVSVIRPNGFTPLQSGRWVSPVVVPPSADNTFATLAALQASGLDIAYLVGDPNEPDGLFIKADGVLIRQSAGSITVKQLGTGTEAISAERKTQALVAGVDFTGVDPTGETDTTAALTAALLNALELGRAIHLPGRYLVSELKFPGTPALVSRHLEITGEPTFIQAVPNKRVLMIQDSPLQQSAGHRFSCTVVPHVDSDKADANNVACDLTGFSTSRIRVRLGVASSYTSTKGRFNTVVFSRSNSPFHYGNHIDYIANSVPAPKYGVRFGNGGSGVAGNPNINTIRAWCVALDTVSGDVLIDVGDSTQAIIEGPTLLEGCPNALGIKAGNLTSIRDVWFELIGSDIDFTNTLVTVPNNCSVERCYFSGGGHTIRIANDLGAPPVFEACTNDQLVTYLDQGGSPIGRPAYTHGYPQIAAPPLAYLAGAEVPISPDQASTRHRVNHHGCTTFQLRYIANPPATPTPVTGVSYYKMTVPTGYEVEDIYPSAYIQSSGVPVMVALADALDGSTVQINFATAVQHIINIRVTLRATS